MQRPGQVMAANRTYPAGITTRQPFPQVGFCPKQGGQNMTGNTGIGKFMAMRGYFAIGIDGVSKSGNMGNLIRTAHGFGAAFVFSIAQKMKDGAPEPDRPPGKKGKGRAKTDTSKSANSVPYYAFESVDDLVLPEGCKLVAVEITDDAVDMPSFRHPLNAAYILGSERMSVSPAVLEKCDHVIKIPTQFSLNVATAGAIVMYDRLLCYGRFAERPVSPSGEAQPLPAHVHGMPVVRPKKSR